MSRELIVSSTVHETKVALLEEDELVEVFFEREKQYGLAGSIYKGKVTRVLPGMQSAFVNIGLERDAFLYVSDFFEDNDEYDRLVTTVEEKVVRMEEKSAAEPAPPAIPVAPADDLPAPPPQREASTLPRPPETPSDRGRLRRGRRRRMGRGFPDSKFARSEPPPPQAPTPALISPAADFEVLPGESLAKHARAPEPEPVMEVEAGAETGAATQVESVATLSVDALEPSSPQEPEQATAFDPEEEGAQVPAKPEPLPEDAPTDPEAEVAAAVVAASEAPAPADQAEAGLPQQASHRERPFGRRYLHRSGRRPRRRDGQPEGRPERSPEPAGEPPAPTSISDLLREGQEVLVQIAKEPIGKKGARITSHIALPGRFLVYMPTVDHVGVSRRVASDEERQRLKRIVQTQRAGMPGGFIVRTAGEGQSEEEIRSDMHFLYNLWLDLRAKAERHPAPHLVHQDLHLVERILRDQLTENFKTIWVDAQEDYERILQFVERFQPSLVGRVKLFTRSNLIFDEFGITQELEKALRAKVWLKSGGYIVINQTEALVAIDVNTGKYVGKSNRLEDTIFKTNLEAAHQIARQIRLRDLGGIIVVDFIDMDERKNRQKVLQTLDEELHNDRSPSKILQFNDFGLVAITRKRVKQSLERTLCSPCSYCDGGGWVKSVHTMVQEILAEARKMSGSTDSRNVTLRVHPEVAKALKSRGNAYLEELEGLLRRPVLVKGDALYHQERFDFN